MHKPYLKEYYIKNVIPELVKKHGYKNVHDIPQITKVIVSSGINADAEKAWIKDVEKDISALAGQKSVVTLAKKSISNFKLRQGMPNGVMVTLRGNQMFEFLYRLINISLPLIRDFRGMPKKLDGNGNYNFGVSDHGIFPEIKIESSSRKSIGLNVTIVTSAETDEEARDLLTLIGMPFRK